MAELRRKLANANAMTPEFGRDVVELVICVSKNKQGAGIYACLTFKIRQEERRDKVEEAKNE